LKRILIIQTASLGDVILSTPLIEKLHHFYPDARLDFLLKKGYESVFREHPYLDLIITWDKTHKKYKHLKALLQMIRKSEYDAVINLQRFASSGFLTAFSNAKQRIGFNKNPFSILFTKRIKHRIGKSSSSPHETERNLKLIEHLTDTSTFPLKLYPSQQDFAKTSQYKTKKYITISPASLWFTKQFPEDKWIEFVKATHATDPDLVLYFLGSENEAALCDRIIEKAEIEDTSMNLAGKFSILESATLMKDASMNYVNDSAPMHMASAMNAATTAIYCSTVPEFGFGPLAENSRVVQVKENLNCRPCGLHGFSSCPEKHFDCAYKIDVKQLTETL